MKNLVHKKNIILKALGNNSKNLGKNVKKMRTTFTNSIFSNKNLKKGEKLTRDKICFMKPGYGISPFDYKKILNKKIRKNIKKHNLILLDDIS